MTGLSALRSGLLTALFCGVSGLSSAAAVVGQPAPAFVAKDTAGKSHALADFRGKTVVLEWINPGCPYVRKHYSVGNMQATQKDATDKGVVWLAVNSTAKDATDYLPPEKLSAWMREQKASATATLMDVEGKVGRSYGARTTPHMYVIDAKGLLVYAGAIDNKPTSRSSDIAGATNHVTQALNDVLSNKPVRVGVTQPYGCSVKYAAP